MPATEDYAYWNFNKYHYTTAHLRYLPDNGGFANFASTTNSPEYLNKPPWLFMKQQLNSFVTWCRRYISVTFVIVLAFVFFVLFFNDNSVMHSFELNQRINELELEISENEDTLQHYRRLNRALNTDAETMERIVRENYHMQRPSEDVYIVE